VVVAKLDRLSRDVSFIAGLMAQKVPFVVAELQQTACKLRLPFLYIGAEVLIAWILFDRPA
jgi:hypothetical protein